MYAPKRPLLAIASCVIAVACTQARDGSPRGRNAGATGAEAGSSGSSAGGSGGNDGAGNGAGGAQAPRPGGSGATGGAALAGSGGQAGGSGGASGAGGNAGAGMTEPQAGAGGGNAVDAAVPAMPDAQAAPDTKPPSSGGIPAGPNKVVILHDANAGGSANDPSRRTMVDILNAMKDSHGIVVELMDSPTAASALMDKALVIVGPNARMFGDNHPDPGLRTLPVPIIVSKDGNTTEIGLGRVGATDPPNFNRITIIKADHPLAAGLPMGSVSVLTTPNRQRIITFTGLGPDAIKIATGPQSMDSFAIVAYDEGADMGNGLRAPAKRVGFFWHRPAGPTPEGRKLFEAAVDWAMRP